MSATYLETLTTQFPDIQEKLLQCVEYLDKRLYHQVTDLTEELLNLKPDGFDFIQFEEKVLRDIRKNMNLLRYGEIVVRSSLFNLDSSPKEGINFISQAIDSIDSIDSILLLRSQIAYFELKQDWKKCKETLETIENELKNSLKPPPPTVYAHFYFVSALLWKSQNNSEKYYRNGISYLGYSNLESIDINKQSEWAENLSIAAMVSPNFYDFGELSLHPIMQSLKGTQREWVLNVLTAFIEANLDKYQKTLDEFKSEIDNEELLRDSRSILDEKIRLLALVRLAFDKPSFERVLTFDEIINITNCKSDDIEILIMRAMSLGLISGTIDGIENKVSILHVKPRILDLEEISNLSKKTANWMEKIADTHAEMEPIISDLFK